MSTLCLHAAKKRDWPRYTHFSSPLLQNQYPLCSRYNVTCRDQCQYMNVLFQPYCCYPQNKGKGRERYIFDRFGSLKSNKKWKAPPSRMKEGDSWGIGQSWLNTSFTGWRWVEFHPLSKCHGFNEDCKRSEIVGVPQRKPFIFSLLYLFVEIL